MPQQLTTNQRLSELAEQVKDHKERLDQHEQRLNKYDIIIATLQTLQQTMSSRLDTAEGLTHDTAKALLTLQGRQDNNRLWLNWIAGFLLSAFGASLGVVGSYLVAHLVR